MNKKIEIFDTTLRDGEQTPICKLNSKVKVEIAKQLEILGVNVIEVGFPISSLGEFKSIVDISKEIKSPIICVLSRAIKKDIDIAVESLKMAKRPRINTGIGTSKNHIRYKFNTTYEKIIERAVEAVKYAKKYIEDVEFYAEDAGRTNNEILIRICENVIKAGATVLNIPDTTGCCLPNTYGEKIKYLRENVNGIHKVTISTHCHNDLGLATANSLFGVINGARQVECTINGLGERAGNTSLEEIVMIFKTNNLLNFYTDIKSELLYDTSKLVSKKTGMIITGNKAIVGNNAFSHSSGIHQDGLIKKRETYEIISPKDVGIKESSIILTARSGRSALEYRYNKIGYYIAKNKLHIFYVIFLKYADKKKEILDDDLILIWKELNLIKQIETI